LAKKKLATLSVKSEDPYLINLPHKLCDKNNILRLSIKNKYINLITLRDPCPVRWFTNILIL
jgi:hypothetical protein